MRPYDISRPGTMEQLQSIYTNGSASPREIQQNIQVNAPQGAEWIRQTESRYGINDAARMFENDATNRQMAQFAARQGAPQQPQYQSDYQRIAAQAQQVAPMQTGMSGPNDRYALSDNSSINMTPEERSTFRQLPQTKQIQTDPYAKLTNFDRSLMAERKQTPASYVMNRRLGEENRYFTNEAGQKQEWVNQNAANRFASQDLYIRPEFQQVYQKNPQQAAHAFEALTGQKLQDYEGIRGAKMAELKKLTEFKAKSGYEKFSKGTWRLGPDDQIEAEEFTVGIDGKYVPSGKWSPVTGFQKEEALAAMQMFPGVMEEMKERARKNKDNPPKTEVRPNKGDVIGRQIAEENRDQAMWAGPQAGVAASIFETAAAANPPLQKYGRNPIRARQIIAAMQTDPNSKWNQLKDDPAARQALIANLQTGDEPIQQPEIPFWQTAMQAAKRKYYEPNAVAGFLERNLPY